MPHIQYEGRTSVWNKHNPNATPEERRLAEREDKRRQRLRRSVLGLGADGKPLKDPKCSTSYHPQDCICYDCLWGERAEMKRRIKGILVEDEIAAASPFLVKSPRWMRMHGSHHRILRGV